MNAALEKLLAVAKRPNGKPAPLSDREFLPADLEILETPPSPVRMTLILIIGALVLVALAWSWFGRLDIIAVAQGKIQPTGRVKVIQPLEPGKIAAILVENGRHVAAGDVLVAFDPGDARAEEANAQGSFDAYRAEATRRRAALDAARIRRIDPIPAIAWEADAPANVREREERVLESDLRQLAASVADYDAQIHQKDIERQRSAETMAAQDALIATLQQRVDMRASLAKSGSGSRSNLIDAQESLDYHKTQLAMQKGQRDAALANIDVLKREMEKAYSAFLADNAQKLAEAQRQADDWREKLVKAKLKSARTKLTAPMDGTVYGLSVNTIGQVVGGGDELMRIVPEGAALEIECYLPNRDVGFVKPGQSAVVKIESFPFTRYGTLPATVTRVSSDAIPEPEAQQRETDTARLNREKTFAGAQRTQNLVFPVTLTPSRVEMTIDGQTVPLTPGMAVSVEVATGNRRILEYIFSPLVQTASEAMKER
ncbi:secretion protein HylD [Rhodoblastus sphagnicola]|uniref:Membrane fusion protein (MFP) family protein n=1 Tax=Rhodoblastus sphagnicola TaxID=333368 RepID=A0A2S6NBA5_9HYPH|nr:HlyD family type I secretion periplasmic adaptor subunit [Rhodoblastus sphagnicola]MBB4197749.1 hemolysin D [Rhodoblastus sphagnicola]PPQ31893.1 secretion protein HylD [Rhodoblastus sphagnicola]